jgi:hypothetical protein
MTNESPDASITRGALGLSVEVQQRIDRIFASNPNLALLIPYQGEDGELKFWGLDDVDMGL